MLPAPLEMEEESAVIKELATEYNEKAKKVLIEHNLRLVVYIAKKFDNTGIGVEDLISIGTIGLIKAINTFNPTKKIKLATYASRCIENEILMYGVQPILLLEGREQKRVERILEELLEEEREQRFSAQNISIYLAMQLHALYCRYAMEKRPKDQEKKQPVWNVIQRVLLDTSKTVSLEEYAREVEMSPVTLNRNIEKQCGYTFFQLQKMGKIYNACALLHFPDLNLQYISDYLGFTNIEDFYRVFKRYQKVSVREYQTRHIGNGVQMQSEEEGLQILEYLLLHFQKPFQIREMEQELKKNAYLLEKRAKEQFGKSVQELLEEVRIQIACSYLSATDRAVTQISSDVGFGSISSFQRSFAKYMNQTPSEYRRFHRCK